MTTRMRLTSLGIIYKCVGVTKKKRTMTWIFMNKDIMILFYGLELHGPIVINLEGGTA